MSYSVAGFDGLGLYPDGLLPATFPWASLNALTEPAIVSGAGAFSGEKGLSFNRGTTALAPSMRWGFPGGGYIQAAGASPINRMVLGYANWIRVDAVAATLAATPLIQFGTGATPTFPLIGLSNSAAAGLSLVLPGAVGNLTASPRLMSIATNQYYWVSLTFAIYPGKVMANYRINGVPIFEGVELTQTGNVGTAALDSLIFSGGPLGATYSIDDFVVQANNASMPSWTFTDQPTLTDIPSIPPRRVTPAFSSANGSMIEWKSSDAGVPNYEAAASTDPAVFVESLDSGQTDLYKYAFAPGANVVDPIAVCVRQTTNKYHNVTQAARTSATGTLVTTPGIETKGAKRVITVQETNPDGEKWTQARIETAEFGQQSL